MSLILGISITFIIFIFVLFYLLKIFKNKGKKNDNRNIKQDLSDFKKLFQNQSNKRVFINELQITENFNTFPFISDFKNIKEKYPSDSLISSLKHTQNSFYDYWANKEFDFFVIFEKLSKEKFITLSSENLIKVYNEFSISIFNLYKDIFISNVIPSIISKFENKSYKLITPDRINDFVDEQFIDFCKGIDKIIMTIETEFYQNKSDNSGNENSNFVKKQSDEKLSRAYRILEVSPFETDEKIKKAYLKLAKIYHPDRNNKEYAKEKMAEINDAYDTVLKDRKKD
ncbi:J domain-containing protein [Spiroplasma sp. BIUS-1]|uniref:J domain-containing protein n=1 Tax=Spiroplasma sp. BIUS-1 TaxID=216964 RepID=UPI001398611F|nr:DnaJ domain-containing protein [Spiroplasma sp. BIUS-1]QHX36464.1 hypothetical protein SBIUS_v1c02110 [Spiroplasma sp. BIUS-1]